MMGYNHVRSGALVWLAASSGWAAFGLPTDPVPVLGGALVSGALARFPDIDHELSTVSRTWGAPLHVLYRIVKEAVFVITWTVGLVECRSFYFATCKAKRVRSRWFRHRGVTHWATFAIGLGAVCSLPTFWIPALWWLGPAVTVGCLTHDLGDMLTYGKIQFWYPLSKKAYALRLFYVGRWGERFVVTPLLLAGLVVGVPSVAMLAGWTR